MSRPRLPRRHGNDLPWALALVTWRLGLWPGAARDGSSLASTLASVAVDGCWPSPPWSRAGCASTDGGDETLSRPARRRRVEMWSRVTSAMGPRWWCFILCIVLPAAAFHKQQVESGLSPRPGARALELLVRQRWQRRRRGPPFPPPPPPWAAAGCHGWFARRADGPTWRAAGALDVVGEADAGCLGSGSPGGRGPPLGMDDGRACRAHVWGPAALMAGCLVICRAAFAVVQSCVISAASPEWQGGQGRRAVVEERFAGDGVCVFSLAPWDSSLALSLALSSRAACGRRLGFQGPWPAPTRALCLPGARCEMGQCPVLAPVPAAGPGASRRRADGLDDDCAARAPWPRPSRPLVHGRAACAALSWGPVFRLLRLFFSLL